MPTKLDERLITDALTALPGWAGGPAGLTRTVSLPEDQTATLLAGVDEAAASMDHHPDVARDGGRTSFTLVTHSIQGVSELDVMLASRISGLVDIAQGKRLVGTAGMPQDMAGGASVGSASHLSDAGEVSTAGAEGHAGPAFGDRPPASGEPSIGVPAVSGGSVIEPGVAMPDTAPGEPEPGVDVEGDQGG